MTPCVVEKLFGKTIVHISAGGVHSAAVTDNYAVFTFVIIIVCEQEIEAIIFLIS